MRLRVGLHPKFVMQAGQRFAAAFCVIFNTDWPNVEHLFILTAIHHEGHEEHEGFSSLNSLRITIRESFRGSRKFPSGYSDCLDLEENSPRRRGAMSL